MKPTLIWQDWRCSNAPEGWVVGLTHDVGRDDDWGWHGRAGERAVYRRRGFPTAEAAQIDCEAFLWETGVLPLPEWIHDPLERDGWCENLHVDAAYNASVLHAVEVNCATWEVADYVACGECVTLAEAKSIAETVLRTLIARALRGEP